MNENRESVILNFSVPENIGTEISSIITHFDIITVRVLQKFYKTGRRFPGDVNCYYVSQLHSELRREGLRIEVETLRKRLDTLVKLGFLEKVNTYPRLYMPVKNIEKIRSLIEKVKSLLL